MTGRRHRWITQMDAGYNGIFKEKQDYDCDQIHMVELLPGDCILTRERAEKIHRALQSLAYYGYNGSPTKNEEKHEYAMWAQKLTYEPMLILEEAMKVKKV